MRETGKRKRKIIIITRNRKAKNGKGNAVNSIFIEARTKLDEAEREGRKPKLGHPGPAMARSALELYVQ